MFDSIKARLIAIAVPVILPIASLWPRETTTRVQHADGTMADSTHKAVNLKRGLDIQGGIHLALELDESNGRVANCKDATDRGLKVIRTRMDEFGVAEPLVQKEGDCRIIVELPGINDPGRARDSVKRSAFLQFQMLDEDGTLF